MTTNGSTRHVRMTLLALLGISALCAMLTLVFNASAFDGVRPAQPVYREMRDDAQSVKGESQPKGYLAVSDPASAPPDGPDIGDIFEDGLASLTWHRHKMDASHWALLRQLAAALETRLDEPALQPQLTRLRAALKEIMTAAARPGAPYGGGVHAFAVAATVGNESTWQSFLLVIRSRDTVIAKLPLTHERDDLAFLDTAIGAVAAKGTTRQRTALAEEIATALRTERDPDARRLWLRYETALQDQPKGDGS